MNDDMERDIVDSQAIADRLYHSGVNPRPLADDIREFVKGIHRFRDAIKRNNESVHKAGDALGGVVGDILKRTN